MKIPMSSLKPASERKLLKAMDMDDIRTMAYLSSDVAQGLKPVCQYREMESKMVVKYGFLVKG